MWRLDLTLSRQAEPAIYPAGPLNARSLRGRPLLEGQFHESSGVPGGRCGRGDRVDPGALVRPRDELILALRTRGLDLERPPRPGRDRYQRFERLTVDLD